MTRTRKSEYSATDKSFIDAYREARKELAAIRPRYEYLTRIVDGFEQLDALDEAECEAPARRSPMVSIETGATESQPSEL